MFGYVMSSFANMLNPEYNSSESLNQRNDEANREQIDVHNE